MPTVVAYDDVKAGREHHQLSAGAQRWRTWFMRPKVAGVPRDPHAFLAEGTPKRVIRPHFHRVDQFQVIVRGGGVIGKHPLAINAVHFARAHTPYGPIVGGEEGLAFLTLRSLGDPTGRHHFPQAKDELKSIPNRDPWQVTEVPQFRDAGAVSVSEFARIRDEHGLAAFALRLKPGARTSAPDPSQSDGQYLIVTKGSLKYQGKDHQAITIAFVKPEENALEMEAGADGLEALVLNFPRQRPGVASFETPAGTAPVESRPAQSSPMRVWQCQLCAFTYDEAKGMPEEGIAPGTRWEDVPADWSCPDCSAGKADFEMQVIG